MESGTSGSMETSVMTIVTDGPVKGTKKPEYQSIWSRPSTIDGKIAPVRSAHSSVLLNDSIIAIFGGWDGTNALDDLVFYNIELASWIIPKLNSKTIPTRRAGHTATLLPDNQSFLVFGGSDGERYLSDMYIFDLSLMEWKEVAVSGGIKPTPRSRHSATLVSRGGKHLVSRGGKHLVYVYGGTGADNTVLNSLYTFDIESLRWSIVDCTGDLPPAIWGHSSTYLKDSLYFIGGESAASTPSAQPKALGVSVLDLSSHQWRVGIPCSSIGPSPTARMGHTITVFQEQFVLLGGGQSERLLNDCFTLNPATFKWQHFTGENPPPQRCAHSTEIKDGRIYIYGGTDGHRYFKDIVILDVEKVLQRLENTPKKRIRLRPMKKSSEAALGPTAPAPQTTSIHISSNMSTCSNDSTDSAMSVSSFSTTLSEGSSAYTSSFSTSSAGYISDKQPLEQLQHIQQLSLSAISPSEHPTPTNVDIRFQSLVKWLTENNLYKYKDNFIRNDITLDTIDYLTEEHLRNDLEISTLGSRLKILNLIQQNQKSKDIQNKVSSDHQDLKDSISSLRSISDALSSSLGSLNSLIHSVQQQQQQYSISTSSTSSNNNNNNNNYTNSTSNNYNFSFKTNNRNHLKKK